MSGNVAEIIPDEETQVEKKCKKYNEDERRNDEKSSSICRKIGEKELPLFFIDNIISQFIVGPLIIGFWRGLWGLIYFYDLSIPDWHYFVIGSTLHWTFVILREVLHKTFAEKWKLSNYSSRIGYKTIQLVYTHLFGASCIMQWYGGWSILNSLMGTHDRLVFASTCFFIIALLMLKSSRNLLAPPFVIVVDLPNYTFNFPTRYRTNSRDFTLYILDCAFSVGVVGTLVVFVWRGIWVLLDYHLFPGNREYSAVGSMVNVIGYMLVGITFCFQPMMRYICSRLRGLSRLLAADVFLFLSFLGTVNVWRGIWGVLDLWLLPEDVELSCWITHIGCFIFLGLLNCSNSILVRGVYIDAEEEEGRCVVFPCHYLRLFFKIEREKKEARRKNLGVLLPDYEHTEATGKDAENGSLINCSQTSRVPTNSEIDMV